MTKISNHYSHVHVNIAVNAPIFTHEDGQRTNFTTQNTRQVTWLKPYGNYDTESMAEFRAIPIDSLEIAEDFKNIHYLPSEYDREDWYIVERIKPDSHSANSFLVHGDYLIPLNASYPTLITMLPRLQEMLALAQLEASILAQKPELRLGPADRLMAHMTNLSVNFPFERNK